MKYCAPAVVWSRGLHLVFGEGKTPEYARQSREDMKEDHRWEQLKSLTERLITTN